MMDKEYYIVVNDNREGPFSLAQLSERGIEPSTLVWTAGLADWTRADSLPELAHLLAHQTTVINEESAFGAYARPEEPARAPYQPYQKPQQYGSLNNGTYPGGAYSNPPTNWKTVAIVVTVVGFFISCIGGIVGIFAWVNASKAENAMRYGDEFTARSAWSTCKTLCVVSLVFIGIGLIVNILNVCKVISLNQFLFSPQ